ncbi:MAG: hypothetical protein EAZ43_01040 [Betaproteobacteria bacterium]|nr:MAG: hypothetical protein EAZ43_01040 [Betaproteobacteria bacterium]
MRQAVKLGALSIFIMTKFIRLSALLLAATSTLLTTNAVQALQAVRASAAISIDGKLDDADWQRAPLADRWTENMPNEKAPARFKTEVRFLYDQNALYVGMKAFDPDVSKIDAPFVRRDKVFGTQDNFVVWIDPTGARKFAQFFRVNARGFVADGSWNEDTSSEDFSPDYDFEAATHIDRDFWSAEMRIPWTSLRVPQPLPEKLTFIVFRNMPRETRIRSSTAVLGREPTCFLCVADELTGISGIPKTSGVTVTPFASGTFTQEKVNGKTTSESKFNAGADVKWRPTSQWVIDGTFRPDFSQLELDQPQLKSNTRFAIYQQEKRPFFLEGSDLLSLVGDSIYTRSITDPLWGARATYRSESADATVITVADRGGGVVVLPNTYFSDFRNQGRSQSTIARVRIPLGGGSGTGSVGALLSDRTYEDDSSNRVVAVDANFKPNDSTRLRAQLAGSQTRDGTRRGGHNFFTDALYDDGTDHLYANYSEFSPNYRFDNALISQNGFRSTSAELWRCFKPKDQFLNNICPSINARETRSWQNVALQRYVTPGLFANGLRNSEWNLQPRFVNYRRVQEGGRWHHTPAVFFHGEGSPGGTLRSVWTDIEVGRSIDVATDSLAKLSSIAFGGTLRPFERIEIEPYVNDFRLFNINGGQWRLIERTSQLTGVAYLTARDSLRLIAQYTLSKRNPVAYSFPVTERAQTDALSLVYSHKRGLGREFDVGITRSNERAALQSTRSTTEIFAKLSWAMSL